MVRDEAISLEGQMDEKRIKELVDEATKGRDFEEFVEKFDKEKFQKMIDRKKKKKLKLKKAE